MALFEGGGLIVLALIVFWLWALYDVITVEPGLYRSGYGGLRLEDLVLVTRDGHEVLTDYPYDLEP